MSNVVDIKANEQCPDVLISGQMPLIKPGIYDLSFMHSQTGYMFGRAPKVMYWFKIISMGDYFDTKIPRYYNAKRLIGQPKKYGNFEVGVKSDLVREFFNLFPHYKCKRLDRLPTSMLEGVIVKGRVETVKKDYKQRKRHEILHYSIITELLEVKSI